MIKPRMNYAVRVYDEEGNFKESHVEGRDDDGFPRYVNPEGVLGSAKGRKYEILCGGNIIGVHTPPRTSTAV